MGPRSMPYPSGSRSTTPLLFTVAVALSVAATVAFLGSASPKKQQLGSGLVAMTRSYGLSPRSLISQHRREGRLWAQSLLSKTAGSLNDASHLSSCHPATVPKPLRMMNIPMYAGRRGGGGKRFNRNRGPPQKEDNIVANEQITAPEVRVLDEFKQQLGVMSTNEAIQSAKMKSMDLILLNPSADPPLCRIVKKDKYRYELQRAEKEKSKQQRQARVDVKELKMRPNTDVHDYQVRLRKAVQFLEAGDRVKLSCQFKGREMAFQNQGRDMMQKFLADLDGLGTASEPRMAGRTMQMIITPIKGKKVSTKKKSNRKEGDVAGDQVDDEDMEDSDDFGGLETGEMEDAAAAEKISEVAMESSGALPGSTPVSVPDWDNGSEPQGSGLVDLDSPPSAGQGEAQADAKEALPSLESVSQSEDVEPKKEDSPSSEMSSTAAAAAAAATEKLLGKPQLKSAPRRPNISQ